MKKLVLLCITVMISLSLSASDLLLIETNDLRETKALFLDKDLVIHYYTDHFVIASSENGYDRESILLTSDAFADPATFYYVLWQDPGSREKTYRQDIGQHADILYETDDLMVVSASTSGAIHLYPAIHGGMVRITDREARLPEPRNSRGSIAVTFSADIEAMLAEVNQDSLESIVQHLENYGTRNAYAAESALAQNWIFEKFASYGLDVELHDFSMPGGAASDNVIATLTGTKYPDEYVVLGAHYDSYSFSGGAPGADDNATGTAGILEAARIMSQYDFDRTIIFATWSGEEYGLYGSDAWATEAAADGMNILGYFNMDMAGYLHPGNEIQTDIIAPASANELRQFYKDVCAIYLPDFEVYDGALSGGDSDHTSFNQNGYMGIFPFEDSQNYSPYIHTSNDIIGPSVNSFEMHATFTQAIIANVATMSNRLPAPENLLALAGDEEVSLVWSELDSVDHYNIYRDDDSSPYDSSFIAEYVDTAVVNGTSYSYFVTAVFSGSGEESDPSNEVTATPMPPIALPFFDDYETGGPYWTLEADWGMAENIYHSVSHSMSESPEGEYQANMNASATLRSLDFTGATTATLAFWARHRIESGYDFMYLEVSVDGTNWDVLDSFTGNLLNWDQMTYSLNDYLNEPAVTLRFRFESDVYIEDQGMFIDDIEVTVDGVGIDIPAFSQNGLQVEVRPNPASGIAFVDFTLPGQTAVEIGLYSLAGRKVLDIGSREYDRGSHQVSFSTDELRQGNYFVVLTSGDTKAVRKLVVIR